jgi:hypothetical protein
MMMSISIVGPPFFDESRGIQHKIQNPRGSGHTETVFRFTTLPLFNFIQCAENETVTVGGTPGGELF